MRLPLASAILLFTLCSSIAQTDYYVEPQGDDSNPGTHELPVATLEAARDLIRRQLSIGDIPEAGITVWINNGEYEMHAPLVLNEIDSGTPKSPITWRAVPDADVRLVGGKSIPSEAFKALEDETLRKRLTDKAANKVVVASLAELGIDDLGTHKQYGHALPVSPAALELFFNNDSMTLARYPNDGYIAIGKVIDPGSIPRTGDYSERGGAFNYTDDRHAAWAEQEDVWFQGTFGNGYADDKILVEKIDTEAKSVTLAGPHMYGINSGKEYLHYKALNIFDELDQPGEWYLDRKTSKLYFWPPAPIDGSSIKVSILEDPIICLEGVSNITLQDITVEIGRGIGIYIERGNNNLIAGCTVRNVGTSGIFMGQGSKQTVSYITHDHYEGVPQSRRIGNLQGHIYKYTTWDRNSGTNHRIQSCDVYNTGSGGIYLSGGSKRTLTPGNNVVENCKVSNYNRRNKFLWSGINIDGCGNRIAHCEIFDSNFQAIYAHGNDHVFEYNNIHHVAKNANDVSAWYLGRDPSDRGNVIRYNYWHHIGKKERLNMGIYCDDSTTDVHVYGNVFYKMNTREGVLYSNGGWDLRMENNLIIEPYTNSVVLSPQYYSWAKVHVLPMFDTGGLFEKRLLKDIDITRPPYSERYPELVNYMSPIIPGEEWEGMRSRRNVFTNNVILGGAENPIRLRKKIHAQFDGIENFQTTEDPGFEDYENQNFNLREDSKVFEKLPNFKAIPFDKMGLYSDEYRSL